MLMFLLKSKCRSFYSFHTAVRVLSKEKQEESPCLHAPLPLLCVVLFTLEDPVKTLLRLKTAVKCD